MTTRLALDVVSPGRSLPASLRRRRAALLALLPGLVALSGCSGEIDAPAAAGEEVAGARGALYNQAASFEIVDTGADDPSDDYDFSADLEQKEHCYVEPALQTALPAGRQVRITQGSHLGLCTVMHTTDDPGDSGCSGCGGVGVHSVLAVNRLGSGTSTVGTFLTGTISDEANSGTVAVAKHQSWPASFSSAVPTNDIHEYRISPSAAKVAYTAPHGRIEANVADQVDYILEDSDPDSRNAGWVVQYGQSGSGTNFNHFHITSDDISEVSFPDLGQLFALTDLRYAVSFHGFNEDSYTFDDAAPAGQTCDTVTDKCTHVIVGGDEDLLFRQGVAELLNEVLPYAQRARASGFSSSLWGVNNDNFVNRLAAGGLGLQLEQSGAVRTSYKQAIADTVQSVYDCLIDAPDETRVVGTSSGSVTGTSTSYATTSSSAKCPRFIAEISTSSGTTHTFNAGVAAADCGSASTAHVDYYRWDSGLDRWRRIGGGRIEYSGSCTATKVGFTEPSGTNASPGLFRAVVRATSTTSTPLRGFFEVN